jgi:lipoate-protein ligase A
MPEVGIHRSTWHLLLDAPRPGFANMARDQALLDLAQRKGLAVLRLYRWAPFCLSFGRNEPALRRYDRAKIVELGLDCVRRPTGGRAVWHARELTYAVTSPIALFGSLTLAYRMIHQMLASALESLGVAPSLAPPPASSPDLDAGACFASPAGGEVMVRDRKVVGSAQLQQGVAFLQHGSVLLEDDQLMIEQVTLGRPPQSRDIPLARLVGRSLEFAQVAASIASAALAWSSEWTGWEGEAEIRSLAEGHEERFHDEGWTWRR